ncbi:MAG: VWA domain-containing protein, partial [Verrucomicrobia bacterium]|nr:VWA domain-containing protein [Verrucomicrobiota bacterium]
KYFIKLFEDETNLRAHILLDCSQSMGFKSGQLTKLEYWSYLAAALSHLMLRQNDAVGLVLFDQTTRHYLPPRARATQFRRILDGLETATPRGETDVGTTLHELAERIHRRSLVILISDLLDDAERIGRGLQHFRHNHHEVIVFHVLDNAELTFPYYQMARFKDMEGTGLVVANPKSIRRQYLERMETFQERLRAECFDRQISYVLANTREPYDMLLAEYLEKRSRLG